jgi:hypothetical protein
MATAVLVIGESGVGKSTSIRNLDPKETFIIKVIEKPLPFKNTYTKLIQDLSTKQYTGNVKTTDNYSNIKQIINYVNTKRLEIKNIIIDDFQYVMSNEFMRRASERGFEKFTEIGQHSFEIIESIEACRDDLKVFILTHADSDESGKIRAKTIGKLFNDKVTLEGRFTIIFHASVMDGKYVFLTQNDGHHIAKSPMDMFDEKYIDNDLAMIASKIDEYFNTDVPQ